MADQYGSVVQRFDRTGAWLGELGGYADAAQLGRIGVVGGLATDRAGHVYVLDSENDRVQVFESATGRWLAAWGSTGTGAGRFRLGDNTGAGGIAVTQPTAAVPPAAYVADQYNHRIQAFRLDRDATGDPGHPVLPAGTPAGDVVTAPTPTAQWGAHGDCSTGTCADPSYNSRFNYPQGVAVDARTGHVLVADDDNHRVVEFLSNGTYVRQIGSYGVGQGQFRFPYDVGIDAREPRQLYVADNNNHRVQAFDFATLAFQRTWGQFGTEVGDFGYTRALAAVADDPAGGVAVADTANNRVQTFAPDGAPTAARGIAGPRARLRHAPGGRGHRRARAPCTWPTRSTTASSAWAPTAPIWARRATSRPTPATPRPTAGNGQFNTPRRHRRRPGRGAHRVPVRKKPTASNSCDSRSVGTQGFAARSSIGGGVRAAPAKRSFWPPVSSASDRLPAAMMRSTLASAVARSMPSSSNAPAAASISSARLLTRRGLMARANSETSLKSPRFSRSAQIWSTAWRPTLLQRRKRIADGAVARA